MVRSRSSVVSTPSSQQSHCPSPCSMLNVGCLMFASLNPKRKESPHANQKRPLVCLLSSFMLLAGSLLAQDYTPVSREGYPQTAQTVTNGQAVTLTAGVNVLTSSGQADTYTNTITLANVAVANVAYGWSMPMARPTRLPWRKPATGKPPPLCSPPARRSIWSRPPRTRSAPSSNRIEQTAVQ